MTKSMVSRSVVDRVLDETFPVRKRRASLPDGPKVSKRMENRRNYLFHPVKKPKEHN